MQIKTFRAKTMQQTLNLVRSELGSEATVLHTREVNGGMVRRMLLGRYYEIAASTEVKTPSRLPSAHSLPTGPLPTSPQPVAPVNREQNYSAKYRDAIYEQNQRHEAGGNDLEELQSLVEQLRSQSENSPQRDVPASLFPAFTDMIEADVDEEVARELVERLRNESHDLSDAKTVQSQLVEMLESELAVTGPIEVSPTTNPHLTSRGRGRPGSPPIANHQPPTTNQCRTVALVGPTGVGKTTTIAKLAANFRLRENKRVGLITVDTYRIAAVEQLRTYADIIDLPMEVVSTPREMREAVDRLKHLDLVLMDTAGRSPRDEVRIQELKSLLAEVEPDEVHLVLSAVGSARSLAATADHFAAVGTTAMLITKLDEATGLGNLLSLARRCRLPISYLTDGQNVPDDIQVAKSRELARMILGMTD